MAVITSHDFLRAVQKEVPIKDIRTAVANLAAEISARLGEGKDLAIGLLLTEQGSRSRKSRSMTSRPKL